MFIKMRWKFCLSIILHILIAIAETNRQRISPNKLHTLYLDNDHIKLSWLIDWTKEEVLFYVDHAFDEHDKWFSFGFSKRGDFEQSDICFFFKNNENSVDTYIDTNGKMYKDYQQDCEVIRIDKSAVAFKRKFDTCDPQDLQINEGTMYILWSHGSEMPDFLDETPKTTFFHHIMRKKRSDTTHSHPDSKHHVMAQLLRADKLDIPETGIKEIQVRLDNVPIPAQETMYWCHIQKLDDFLRTKHHIVQFEPIVSTPSIVHHMEVFHCETGVDTEIPLYNGNCDEMPAAGKVCSRVIALWAMGASSFTYPKEAGLPIGGPNYNPFIRLEVHFNNPDEVDGLTDSSGMIIKMVSELRKYDAAIMELGLEYTDKMAIPPGVLAFPLSGYCISECTKIALPETGITIFGSQLHTHLRGVRILTRHFRDGMELPNVNRDDYYSHHYQELRYLRKPVKVLPGDALITTCYYDMTEYKEPVLGGFSISDEMCVNYIQYYPATELELCKSAVSEKTLYDYFHYLQHKDNQPNVKVDGGRSENYHNIEWTETRIDELFTMYTQEPLSMSCNRSNGMHFDGFNWEGAPITPAPIQIPFHRNECDNYNPYGVIPLDQGRCGYLGECIY